MIPVSMPPVLKLIRRGARLEKSFAGERKLAAMLVERVAIVKVTTAMTARTGLG